MTNHPVLPLLDRITPEQFQLWSSSVTTRAEFETLNQSWDDLATPDFARLSFEQTKNWIRTVARRTGEQMIIKVEDFEERNYEATVELEADGLVWFTIEKSYKSDNPSFSAFLPKGFAEKLGEALIKVSKGLS